MVIFLLILIAIAVVFGHEAGQGFLFLSMIAFVLILGITLIVRFLPQISSILLLLLGGVLLVHLLSRFKIYFEKKKYMNSYLGRFLAKIYRFFRRINKICKNFYDKNQLFGTLLYIIYISIPVIIITFFVGLVTIN